MGGCLCCHISTMVLLLGLEIPGGWGNGERESGKEGRAILNYKMDTDHILARDRNLKRWGGERVFGTFFYHPFGTQVVL